MLTKDILNQIQQKIKEINKEKKIDTRVEKLIIVKDELRNQINEELDELFSTVNLRKSKLNWGEE